jgi:hypothetical protein
MEDGLLQAWAETLDTPIEAIRYAHIYFQKLVRSSPVPLFGAMGHPDVDDLTTDFFSWMLEQKTKGVNIKAPKVKLRIIDYLRTRSRRKRAPYRSLPIESPDVFPMKDVGPNLREELEALKCVFDERLCHDFRNTDKVYRVYIAYVFFGRKMKDCAQLFGMSESRIVQIVQKVNRLLKEVYGGTQRNHTRPSERTEPPST